MNFDNIFNQFDKNNKSSFAETIAQILKDQNVEIFLGDTYETIKQSDYDVNTFAIMYGKIVAGYGDCLLINSFYVDGIDKELKAGNIILINAFNIKAISLMDDKGTIQQALIGSRHIRKHRQIKKRK